MSKEIERSTLLKTGLLHGSAAGCLGAGLFVLIIFLVIFFAVNDEILWIIPVSIIGGLFGAVPATVIGAISGLIMGWGFYLLQGLLPNNRSLLFFVAALGLLVALPGIVLWADLLLNDFKGFPTLRNNLQLFLLLAPFCVFASIHVTWKLRQAALGPVSTVRSLELNERENV